MLFRWGAQLACVPVGEDRPVGAWPPWAPPTIPLYPREPLVEKV